MRIGLAQINTTVGDLAGNVQRCIAAVAAARRQGADLVVLPEMAVPGYPPRDILYDPSFVEATGDATDDLARCLAGGPPAIVGTIVPSGTTTPGHPGLHNTAALLHDGTARTIAVKRLLPTYDVFFEQRWFFAGPPMPPCTIAGKRVGVLICEDMWDEGYPVHPAAEALAAGADLLVAISASPYRPCVMGERLHHARRPGCPLVHVNLCGATDELIFDGSSFAVDSTGRVVARLPSFEEAVHVIDLVPDGAVPVESGVDADPFGDTCREEELFRALVLGIRDFVRKNGLPHVFLGLSGGVDSALVAILAAEAVGPDRVTAIAVPSRYTDPRSTTCAEALARTLGIGFETVALEPLHVAAEATLGDLLSDGTTAENIQARLRAVILMSFVNHRGGMLLNTSNKTELALGYGTLYGDLAGTLSPIGDLTKTEVYALAQWIQTTRGGIPPFILERPPSAELKPNQVDPFDYPKVAPLLEEIVQTHRSNAALRRSEHKRRHMGIVLKVSKKAFGTGRLIPITRR